MTRISSKTLVKALCLIATLLVFAGCGKTDLRLKMAAGDVRTVNLTSEMTPADGAGQGGKTLTRYRFQVENVDTSGAHSLNVTIEKGDFTGLGELESLTKVLPTLDALTLDGKEFKVVIDPLGVVTSVQGMDAHARDLADKLLQAIDKGMTESNDIPPMIKNQMAAMKGQLEGLVRKIAMQQMGDAAMKDQLSTIFSMYTEKPVQKGMEWTKTYAVRAPLPMNVTEKWTMLDRADGIVKLAFSSEVASNSNAPGIEFMGMKMTTTVTGKVTGTAEIDVKTGWPQRIISDLDLNVDVSFMGMSMPRKLQGKQIWETVS